MLIEFRIPTDLPTHDIDVLGATIIKGGIGIARLYPPPHPRGLSPFLLSNFSLAMASSSLDTNPPNANRNITAGGSDWLWVAFAIMLFSNMIMIFWSFTVCRDPYIPSTTRLPIVPASSRNTSLPPNRHSYTDDRLDFVLLNGLRSRFDPRHSGVLSRTRWDAPDLGMRPTVLFANRISDISTYSSSGTSSGSSPSHCSSWS